MGVFCCAQEDEGLVVGSIALPVNRFAVAGV
jgi:hypothetical protein